MNIVLFGAPGSGKGTQALKIKERYGIPHISTGDMFREYKKIKPEDQTELHKRVLTLMNAGELIPDSITIEMVKERISRPDCKNGFILDGFPRTMAQAEAFERMISKFLVVHIDCPFDVIEDRLSTRRVCQDCNASHSTKTHSKPTCSKCNGMLILRDDDKIEKVRKRLSDYEGETFPLIEFYKRQNRLITVGVCSESTEDLVFEEISSHLDNFLTPVAAKTGTVKTNNKTTNLEDKK